MEVGFIGLGKLGLAMARNLAKAGHRVRAWNRSPANETDRETLTMVATPEDVFQADVVFTMLSDDAAIREALLSPKVLRDAREGVVHVVTSTISVAFAGELAAAHAAARVAYVAAPVFGRPDVAEAAQLNIVAAGAPAAIERVRPFLDVIGRRTWVLGDNPQLANAAKIAGNMMIAMAIEAMAEATVLVESNGVSTEAFLTVMTQTLFCGRVYENYGGKIIAGDFAAGFRMQLGLKDLGLATAAAVAAGRRLPMLEAVYARMTEAVDAGRGDQDWSAVADYTRHH